MHLLRAVSACAFKAAWCGTQVFHCGPWRILACVWLLISLCLGCHPGSLSSRRRDLVRLILVSKVLRYRCHRSPGCAWAPRVFSSFLRYVAPGTLPWRCPQVFEQDPPTHSWGLHSRWLSWATRSPSWENTIAELWPWIPFAPNSEPGCCWSWAPATAFIYSTAHLDYCFCFCPLLFLASSQNSAPRPHGHERACSGLPPASGEPADQDVISESLFSLLDCSSYYWIDLYKFYRKLIEKKFS